MKVWLLYHGYMSPGGDLLESLEAVYHDRPLEELIAKAALIFPRVFAEEPELVAQRDDYLSWASSAPKEPRDSDHGHSPFVYLERHNVE